MVKLNLARVSEENFPIELSSDADFNNKKECIFHQSLNQHISFVDSKKNIVSIDVLYQISGKQLVIEIHYGSKKRRTAEN